MKTNEILDSKTYKQLSTVTSKYRNLDLTNNATDDIILIKSVLAVIKMQLVNLEKNIDIALIDYQKLQDMNSDILLLHSASKTISDELAKNTDAIKKLLSDMKAMLA